MSKVMMALAAVVALAGVGCSSPTAQPTGCTAAFGDAGTMPGVVCDIGWSCSADTQHYQIVCTESGGDFDCTCSTDTTTAVTGIHVTPFTCSGGGAEGAATGCGWNLQM
jgi:hypothetical protein